MGKHHVAVEDADGKHEYRGAVDTIEQAQGLLPEAKAEFPDAKVFVEELVVTDSNPLTGQVLAAEWKKVK